ncbi:hypothetical protein LTR05_002455 [Lithohypha guttulata]|uniref:Uncharacterized protein n=1 Tax=Lithohypha guttulata TaxID=1690604 RepID=A0AAN7T471_9EURO|nr:hypothetical protein LTR05_002455 [Lithohypha guttulata]
MSLTQPEIESQAQDEQQIAQIEDSIGDRVAGEKRKRSVSIVLDGKSLSPGGQPPAKQLKLDQSQANGLLKETEEALAGEEKQEILSTPEDVVEENKRKDVKMHFRSEPEPEPEPWFSQPLTWLTYNRNAASIQDSNLGRVLTDEEVQARKLRDQTKETVQHELWKTGASELVRMGRYRLKIMHDVKLERFYGRPM